MKSKQGRLGTSEGEEQQLRIIHANKKFVKREMVVKAAHSALSYHLAIELTAETL